MEESKSSLGKHLSTDEKKNVVLGPEIVILHNREKDKKKRPCPHSVRKIIQKIHDFTVDPVRYKCIIKNAIGKHELQTARLPLVLGLGGEALDAGLDGRVDALGHALERQALLHALDGARHGRLDALHAALDGGRKVANVLLPARRPLGRLLGEALVGAGHDHVQRGEDADASGAHDPDLGAFGLGETGNTRTHGCWLCV